MTLVWRRTQGDTHWLAPASLTDAVGALSEPGGRVVAGATWVMRGPLRDEAPPERWISLHRLPELRGIRDDGRVIGAMTTHAEIAQGLAGIESWRELADAAGNSANPAVRNRATLGGNISTIDFPATDLFPALLALDATVEVVTGDGPMALPMGEFVADPPKGIVSSVDLGEPPLRSSHQRLTLRAAGDYPVAIVSVVVPDGAMPPRIAIGSVENRTRRWTELEAALVADTNPTSAREAAAGLVADLHLRCGWLVPLPGSPRGRPPCLHPDRRIVSVNVTVNGENRPVAASPVTALLDVLRDEFYLFGAKDSCREGFCGACTVTIDGEVVPSCLVPVGQLDGADIKTIEALREGGLFPLQQALLDRDAVQCGMCFPGMVISLEAYLAKAEQPSEKEIRQFLTGNLCRCTGYQRIVEAALQVSS